MRRIYILGIGGIASLLSFACALMMPVPAPTPSPGPVITPELIRPTATLLPVPANTPLGSPIAGAENPPGPDGQPMLVLTRPQAGQRVRSPLAVEGTAITFEGVVNVALRDPQGRTLQEGTTVATRGAPERGTFALSLSFAPPATETQGTFEVFIGSPRDGSVLHRLRVPVVLIP